MAEGILPYGYEEERIESGMTALAGLPPYLDLAHVMGLSESIMRNARVREGCQGYTDKQMVMPLVLLSLAGGDCVDDLHILEADEGFKKIMFRIENHGISRRGRRELECRWRKERTRCVPSASSVFRYLEAFDDPQQSRLRKAGAAFVPAPNEHLRGLAHVNKDMIEFVQKRNPEAVATLDVDATLRKTDKRDALYCYNGAKAYQALNCYWAEQEMVLFSEFRDGNVPAGHKVLRVFKESLEMLPEGVREVRLRSDSAACQHELMRYCEKMESERFGRIEFVIGQDITKHFKQALLEVEESDWQPVCMEVDGEKVATGREWAEVCFVPSAIAYSKNAPEYRYLATREALEQPQLPGLEGQQKLPFPAMTMRKKAYKVFGFVTNVDWDGEEAIHWYHARCGKSEQAHAAMKEDFAGAKLPSGSFGENAAWWWIMILSMNLNQAMKRLVLGGNWVAKRMKAIRFALINLPGRIVRHSRQLVIRLSKGHPSFDLLVNMRREIAKLAVLPSG